MASPGFRTAAQVRPSGCQRDQDVACADGQAALGRQISNNATAARARWRGSPYPGSDFSSAPVSERRKAPASPAPASGAHRGPRPRTASAAARAGLRQGRGEARSGGGPTLPVLRPDGQVAATKVPRDASAVSQPCSTNSLIGGVDGVMMHAQGAGPGAGAGQAVAGLQPTALISRITDPARLMNRPGGVFDQFNDDGAASHDPPTRFQESGSYDRPIGRVSHAHSQAATPLREQKQGIGSAAAGAVFYHAGCTVCVDAEQRFAGALNPAPEVEVVHLARRSEGWTRPRRRA